MSVGNCHNASQILGTFIGNVHGILSNEPENEYIDTLFKTRNSFATCVDYAEALCIALSCLSFIDELDSFVFACVYARKTVRFDVKWYGFSN